jgi:hypothetical protein
LYVREGMGKAWYETALDVVGEAGAAVAEAYGGKMAGDGVRAGHKIWTGLAFKDKGGGGSAPPPPPPPPRPRPAPQPMVAQIRFPPNGSAGPSAPGTSFMQFRSPSPPLAFRPPPNTPGPMMTSASMFGGGGSSKGLLIFGVLSAAAIGIYLFTQKKSHVSR